MAKNQHGLRAFGEGFALVGAINGAGSVHGDGNFERNRLRARGCVGGRGRGNAGGAWSGSVLWVFHDGCHKPLTLAGLVRTGPCHGLSRFYLYMVGLPGRGPYSTCVLRWAHCARRVKAQVGTGKWPKAVHWAWFGRVAENSRRPTFCSHPTVAGTGRPRQPGSP